MTMSAAPMTRSNGLNLGTGTAHHDASRPSHLRLHERPRDPSNLIGEAA